MALNPMMDLFLTEDLCALVPGEDVLLEVAFMSLKRNYSLAKFVY